ncbi:MAG: NADH-quinone oxidoreductase subunit NuoH [Candidatus Puniceispirillum sp.]|nr:NADH-quinone oxidoreductase subunit NuoH [Candidatus Pelagibacter sp.]MBA4282770.1 NADH-quinone oxidoreductase subunit NuoH [Candidatus Puniceispirillum sp.]
MIKQFLYSQEFLNLAITSVKIVAFIITMLLSVAYLTFFERKIIGYMQLRVGPQVVGPFGLLQPIADGVKLIHKESNIPDAADKFIFLLAPIIFFTLSLSAWAVIPFDTGYVFSNLNVGILYILAISSLSVYGIIFAGWASNSKYAFLGAIRSAAQMISYEVAIGLIIICICMLSQSMNLSDIVRSQEYGWYGFKLFPLFVIFFIVALAETNRTPFDLPEAEAELVAGYHVEYSSFPFALFFLGEYANMILMSGLCAVLFLGGWLPPFQHAFINWIPGFVWFILKIYFILFLFIWTRATLPRYRYDQLMKLGWKIFLPLCLACVMIIAALILLKG